MTAGVARLVVDTPLPQLDRLFEYAIPESLAGNITPGVRVRVPFHSAGRIVDAFVVEVVESADFSGSLSSIDSVVSDVAVLTPATWRLARAVADRQAGSAIDVLRLAIPRRLARAEKSWLARAHDAASTPDLSDREQSAGGALAAWVNDFPDLLSRLAARERVAVTAPPRLVHLAGGTWVGEWALMLAVAAVSTVRSGSSAVLAVPDYRDQEQLMAALAHVDSSCDVVELDARQPDARRYSSFLRCLEHKPVIVVGNRSAVYAPVESLGLLALWDDGDPLFAEPLAPYAHARDVALLRQHQQSCALLFASHARSVETQRLVEIGWMAESLRSRALAPHVVPTAQQSSERPDSNARIPSSAWQTVREALAAGPVLVQVARPGYMPVLACASCRRRATCERCGGMLRTVAAARFPSCELCGALAVNWSCRECSGRELRAVTIGSARTAEELGRAFPGTRVVVADGEHPVTSVSGESALIVATRGAEPIAAGGYRAVLLLDGERMMARESLSTRIDCVRWWSNAAALGAPGAPVILVGVAGDVARSLVHWRQDLVASRELADRRELRFPPAVRLASVTGARDAVDAALEKVGSDLVFDVLGPVPVDDQTVRAVVRFGYDVGAEVASRLRGAVIAHASSVRAVRRPKGSPRRPLTLKVRLDDPDVL